MNDTERRIDLLLAMASGDVIVLAKLVHTLQPRHVLLFSTPCARQRDWEEKAHRLLESVRGRTGQLIDDYTIALLHGDALEEQLERMRQAVAQAIESNDRPPATVALDATTGPGLLRVLGYEVCRQIIKSHGGSLRLVYCDGDARRVVVAELKCDGVASRSHPLTYRFSSERDHAVERFWIYGVDVSGANQLWPLANADQPRKDHDDRLALYQELCHNEGLRAFFHSYWQKIKDWKTRQSVQQDYPADHIRRFLDQRVEQVAAAIAEKAERKTARRATLRQEVQGLLERAFHQYVRSEGTLVQWLELFRTDHRLDHLNRILMMRTLPRIRQAVNQSERGRSADEGFIANQLRSLQRDLRGELNDIAVARDEAFHPESLKAEEHAAFRRDALTFPLPANLRRFLLEQAGKVARLFEEAISAAVIDILDSHSDLRSAVDSVYQNVELRRGPVVLCELDTLVIFRTGDLLALEVKTHFSNADQKKIESNIKQLRDFGGAYSRYVLVYPLVRTEIRALLDGDQQACEHLESLGMTDAAGWAEHLRHVKHSRDRRVVPLDQLAEEVRRAAGLRFTP